MESLSWIFFCLSPFALFCSEDGNGLILCPVFIILGFVFKWIGSNSSGTPTAVVKVEPQKFWEWHYKDRIRGTIAEKDSISDGLMALRDEEARRWATTICGYHNAWVPPESTQEQIARANGVITKQIIKENTIRKDRIQIGKYILLTELQEKYYGKQFCKKEPNKKMCYPWSMIKNDHHKIELSNGSPINKREIEYKYKMSFKNVWNILSNDEKEQATAWIEEYEKRLLELVNRCLEDGYCFRRVDIEF